MKKVTKKFFALLLTMFMLASLIPFAALAEGGGEISPSEEIQSEFSEENGYTSLSGSGWENEHHVIEDNFCGISGVSAVCDVFAYNGNSNTTVYVCDITITIGEKVDSDELLISDILSNIGNGIVTMPGGYIRFNIHIVDNSGNNYRYLPGSLDMSTPDWVYIDNPEYGPEVNNRGKFTWNPTFVDLGFGNPASLNGKYLEFATALMNEYRNQFGENFSLTKPDGSADYEACNTVLERVLDDYYIDYFNKGRSENDKIASLADLTLNEVAVVAKPGHGATIVDNSEMLNAEISKHIYWRYFYEHCLHAGDSTLVPNVSADQQYSYVYHAYADKNGEPYAYMQQLFANSINNGTTMKFGVKLDGPDTQNAYQNYLFPILMPASFTLVKPADEKEDLPGLKKWIVTILDVEDHIVPVDEEGNLVIPEPPEGYEVIGPILEERLNEDETTSVWLTGWKIKVKSDTIGAGDTVDFLLESNLGTDFLNVFPPNWPLNDSHDPADYNWTVDDFRNYVFTFHDVMAQELVLNVDSFIVKVGNYTLLPGEYTLVQNAEDECTFEIVINDLVQLVLDGKFRYDEIGTLPITVEYSATAIETLSAGSYINRAWVTANEYTTPDDQVVVITYALQVYKHDSAELDPVAPGYTPMPLAGAIFYLYKAEQGHEVTDENGNVIGWEPNEVEEPFKQGTTDENGQLINIETGKPIFDGLDAGTYYIVEVQAPDGYVCDRNYYPINIGGDNEGTPVDLVGFTYTYDVPNVLVPHTGGTGTVIFSVVGACMLVCAGAMYIIYRRRLRTEA